MLLMGSTLVRGGLSVVRSIGVGNLVLQLQQLQQLQLSLLRRAYRQTAALAMG